MPPKFLLYIYIYMSSFFCRFYKNIFCAVAIKAVAFYTEGDESVSAGIYTKSKRIALSKTIFAGKTLGIVQRGDGDDWKH